MLPKGPVVTIVILDEPASKANSREIVRFGNRPASIKSKKARDYTQSVRAQVKPLKELLTCPIHLDIDIYYASMRPDMDESIILDALQGLIYKNDRQVWSRNVRRGLSKARPRAIVHVSTLEGFPIEDVP